MEKNLAIKARAARQKGLHVEELGGNEVEISKNGIVSAIYVGEDADTIRFSQNVHSVKPAAVRSIYDTSDFGFSCEVLHIPKNLTEIKPGAFKNLDGVGRIEVEEESESYKVVDNVLFTKDGKILVYCPADKRGIYSVPEGTEKIANWAFYLCSVRTLILPKSVKIIGASALDLSYIEEIRGFSGTYAEEFADQYYLPFTDVNAESEETVRDIYPRKVTYAVELTAVGEDRIAVLMKLKKIADMRISDVKKLLDQAPQIVMKGLKKDDAIQVVMELKEVGAKAKIKLLK